MSDQQAVDTLNKLLDAENMSFVARFSEACPFAAASEVSEQLLISRLAAEGRLRRQRLTDLILKLRGSPTPPRRAIDTTALHYVDVAHLLPRVAASLRDLANAYSAAGRTGDIEADSLIGSHLTELRRDVVDAVKLAPAARQ